MPLRIEIGPRDIENDQVVFARRDIPGKEGKSFIPIADVAETAMQMLDSIQSDMLTRATEFRDSNTFEPNDYEGLKEIVENGFARTWWCGKEECEDKVKEDTQATIRCIPIAQPDTDGTCIVCGAEAEEITIFARAY